MSDEKWKEFYAWWIDDQQSELRRSCAEGWAYAVWKASRESLVVKLPNLERPTADGMSALFACKKAIESLGLRVKP